MIDLKNKISKISSNLIYGLILWLWLIGAAVVFSEMMTLRLIVGIVWIILSLFGIYYLLKVQVWQKALSELRNSKNITEFFSTIEKFPFLENTSDFHKILLRKMTEDCDFSKGRLTQNQLILLREVIFYLDYFEFGYKFSKEFENNLFLKNEGIPKIVVEPNINKSEAISILIEGYKKEKDKIYPLLCEKITFSNHHELDLDEVVIYNFTFKQGKDQIKLSFL